MFRRIICNLLTPVKGKDTSNGLYNFVTGTSSREKTKVLKKVARMANEEQRKIYYGSNEVKKQIL
jgi:hypothetical protein